MRWWGSEECEFDSRRVLVVEVLDAATAGAAVVRPLRAALPRLREHVSSAVARPPPHEAAHAERVVALLDVGHAFGRLAASELLAHCFGERETVVLGSLDHARVAEQDHQQAEERHSCFGVNQDEACPPPVGRQLAHCEPDTVREAHQHNDDPND